MNLQGQDGTDTYFQITLPVGVHGRDKIRRFMRESLNRSASIVHVQAARWRFALQARPGSRGGKS